MLPLLILVPVATSLILGTVYLFGKQGQPLLKIVGVATFLLAVYLQFYSRFVLVGLLLQIALAFGLALWRKLDRAGLG